MRTTFEGRHGGSAKPRTLRGQGRCSRAAGSLRRCARPSHRPAAQRPETAPRRRRSEVALFLVAAKNALTNSRCCAMSAAGASAPRMRPPRATGELPCCRRRMSVRLTIGAISSNDKTGQVVQHERHTLGEVRASPRQSEAPVRSHRRRERRRLLNCPRSVRPPPSQVGIISPGSAGAPASIQTHSRNQQFVQPARRCSPPRRRVRNG